MRKRQASPPSERCVDLVNCDGPFACYVDGRKQPMRLPFSLPASLVSLASLAFALAASAPVRATADEHYSTHGIVKSFGPRRTFVNIAHEKIPGYMEAMTMSFEPRSDDQLAGIDVGAHVAFTFVATSDGHRVLERIAREP